MLQDAKQKTEDDIERLGQQISEQDHKIQKLNKEMESLKDKEVKPILALQQMSLDIKEYENNLYKINCEMKVSTDRIEYSTQEIKNNSQLIFALQENVQQNMATTTSKFNDVFAKVNNSICWIFFFERLKCDRLRKKL